MDHPRAYLPGAHTVRAKVLALGALLLPAAAFHYGGDVFYLACKWDANRKMTREQPSGAARQMPIEGRKARAMMTHAEKVSQDFWNWFGAKLDADEEIKASMPARDEATATALGDEMLDIEFEPVSQAPERVAITV